MESDAKMKPEAGTGRWAALAKRPWLGPLITAVSMVFTGASAWISWQLALSQGATQRATGALGLLIFCVLLGIVAAGLAVWLWVMSRRCEGPTPPSAQLR